MAIKFYRPHTFADDNWHIQIRQNTLRFTLAVFHLHHLCTSNFLLRFSYLNQYHKPQIFSLLIFLQTQLR